MAEIITVNNIYCTKDTHTTSLYADKVNHNTTSNACGKHSDGYQAYAFFAFADHGIPENAVIVSAEFHGYVYSRQQATTYIHTIRPCSSAWNEELTYALMPTSSDVTSQVSLGNNGTEFSADITNIAQAWFSGKYNYANGFYITSGEKNSYKRIYAMDAAQDYRPYINLTYYVPASKPSFSVSSADISPGTAVNIRTNRMSDTYTHTLSWKLVKQNGESMTNQILGNVGENAMWSIDMQGASIMNTFLKDTTSAMLYIVCTTYDENKNELGTETSSGITMYVPENIVPVISDIAVENVDVLSEHLVQGISRVVVSTTANGTAGAQIVKYETVIGGVTYSSNPVSSGILTSAGKKTAKVTVTDTRGRTATDTIDFTVYAYSAPKILSILAERCNSTGTDAMIDGEYIRFSLNAEAARIHSEDVNPLAVKVYAKLRTGESWTLANTYTSTVDKVNYSGYVIAGTYSNLKSYELLFEITDKLNTTTVYQTGIGTQNVLINFDPDNVRIKFGGIAEADDAANAVTFGMDVHFKNKAYLPDGKTITDAIRYMEGREYNNVNCVTENVESGGGIALVETDTDTNVVVCGKNLLAYPYYRSKQTVNTGIVYTVNADGTIHANGAPGNTSAWSNFQLHDYTNLRKGNGGLFALPAGRWKLVCEGSKNTSKLYAVLYIRNEANNGYTSIGQTRDATEYSFTTTEYCDRYYVYVACAPGYAPDNETLQVMIVPDGADTAYEPYKATVLTCKAGASPAISCVDSKWVTVFSNGTAQVTATIMHGYFARKLGEAIMSLDVPAAKIDYGTEIPEDLAVGNVFILLG